MSFGAALASCGTITPASKASLIKRDAVALFLVSIPNRSRSELLVMNSRFTNFKQA